MAGRHAGARGVIPPPRNNLDRAADVAAWAGLLAGLAGLLCVLWGVDALGWFIGAVVLLELARRSLAWLADRQDAADRRL